ncbi:histidine kinase [Streptomyces sp. ACA25]|uniref:sensor histidine kinase n=1 Tax=Streptomyces sp. ACA25 TaxID=3022596 RepID=UPI002307FE08|nr:histidine kinase [Streptomyces sp. ACA25]MDB1089573.1 histidine kinase [Streptomyces sp. ACA25]
MEKRMAGGTPDPLPSSGSPPAAVDSSPDRRRHIQMPPPRLAQSIAVGTVAYYGFIVVLNVLNTDPTRDELLTSIACVLVVFAVQLVHITPGAQRWSLRRRCTMLTVQAVLTFLPFLLYGLNWGTMAGPLAGSLLLLLPGRVALPMVGGIGLFMMFMVVNAGGDFVTVAYLTLSTMMAGLILFGITRLSHLVTEVHATRREMATMAVANERMRFSRDLHDLLGYSLSAITLKSELAHRLANVNPDRAQREIVSILDLSRRALADVRLVSHAYRDMSLREELVSAEEVLRAADIEVTCDTADLGRLHPAIDTVLAIALREGVTNVLRHSKAEHCHVTVRQQSCTVRFMLENDGVPDRAAPPPPHSGSGLGNLHARLEAVGGTISASSPGTGSYRLTVEAPVMLGRASSPAEAPAGADRTPEGAEGERAAAQ